MCKTTIFECEKKGCHYQIPREKNNIPIDFNPWPRDFKKLRIKDEIYHLCPSCYKVTQKMIYTYLNTDGKNKQLPEQK